MRKDLEERNNALYANLVPSMGNAGTMEGEILRAINKIVYRYYNDGDKYFEGYGCETAGPCHAFLVDDTPIGNSLKIIFDESSLNSKSYEQALDLALEKVLDFIESKDGKYEVSDVDMLNSESHFEEEEEEDLCWDCDEPINWCECECE